MSAQPIRVLVVDDSAFARKVIREILGASAGIEVVGVARDGLDALEQIAALAPDVMTLDLVMPNLDGLGVLAALPAERAPHVVIVSVLDARSDLGIAALEAGAVDVVHKPTAVATDQLYELATELVVKVRAAAEASPARALPPLDGRSRPASPWPEAAPIRAPRPPGAVQAVVVGASTGGPQALARLLAKLPGDLPVPVAIALHIPIGFTADLARRLDRRSTLRVVEAFDGLELHPGLAVLARAGLHLRLERGKGCGRARLVAAPVDTVYRPSVDVLFTSAVEAFGAGVVGVVLTGMGNDGCAGARAIHAAGGAVLTEAESSCVIYGMPRSAVEAGVSTAARPIDLMAQEILRWL
jgi:two-component system chemotaxis response regulator CheB